MLEMKNIYDFAVKWRNKFTENDTDFLVAFDRYMGDECRELGFKMDCGNAFERVYGDAVHNSEALSRIIHRVDDIPLLGSAIFSRWRYFNHWAMSSATNPRDRDWFVQALDRLVELAGDQLHMFKGSVRKIRIISNNVSYGPPPEPDEEVEQRLTINAEGRVWFSAYTIGYGYDKPNKTRSKVFKIEQEAAKDVLEKIAQYFRSNNEILLATDGGMWNLEITNTDGEVYEYKGSLCEDIAVQGVGLSTLIRSVLDMGDLFAFDGNRIEE